MRERDGYVPGVPCWIDTSQPDPRAAVAFYSEIFGWECENVLPPGSPGEYFIARLDGCDVAAVAPRPEGDSPAATWNTYIWVDSADAAAERAWEAGGRGVPQPVDVSPAGRQGRV